MNEMTKKIKIIKKCMKWTNLPSCVKHVIEDNDLTLTLGNWTSDEQFGNDREQR